MMILLEVLKRHIYGEKGGEQCLQQRVFQFF